MNVVGWCILLLLVLPMPFCLGILPVKYMNKSQQTPAMAYACGWIVSFCVFEVVSIPFILLQKSFTSVVVVYTAVILLVLTVSVVAGARDVFPVFIKRIQKAFKEPAGVKAGWLVFGIIVAAQMVYSILFEYRDGDDAYYIATSVITNTYDTMYLRDAYTGHLYPLDIRHAFSPTPIYQAWLSRLTGIGSAVIAHSVLAPVWLVLMYCVYSQIACRLFSYSKNPTKCRKNYRPVFMILISVWYAFGNVSLYTAETFAMTRTWQGKGLMAGIVIPMLILCFLHMMDDIPSVGSWVMLVCTIMSAVFATSVSFMLVPTMLGVVAVLISIKEKKIKKPLLMCACCIPCLVLGALYILMS